jgi:hypothetical protein
VREGLRIVGAIALIAVASVASFVVVLGIVGATVLTGYQCVTPEDEALAGGSACDFVPPWEVGDWLVGAAIELATLAVALAAVWGALNLLSKERPRERRWSPVTRVFVWAFIVFSAGFAVFAGYLHASNWAEWHQMLAATPSIPYEPQPIQIPGGVAVFLAVPSAFTGFALVLRARGRM